MENGAPVLFDCIEFNDLLSDLDVQYDLAFLLMDLDFRDRRDAAVRVHSAYLDQAARSFPDGLWEGLAALPLMLSVRAGVRAHVSTHSGDIETARAYLEAISPTRRRARRRWRRWAGSRAPAAQLAAPLPPACPRRPARWCRD